MSKAILNQRYIYKINSSHLKRKNWNIDIKDINLAIKNRFIISIGDSTGLRIIRQINNSPYTEEYINDIKTKIKYLKKHSNSTKEDKKIMKNLNKEKQKAMLEDSICNVIFDSEKHYDKISKEGFTLNGNKYVLLLGTSGGIKSNTVMFCKESIYEELWKRLINGANLSIPMIPSKLMAYISLAFSSSTPVTNTRKILVVKSATTRFKTKVTNIEFNKEKNQPDITNVDDFEVEVNATDGCCMAMPSLMDEWEKDLKLHYDLQAACIRNAYTKGMIARFNFQDYSVNVLKKEIVKDVWGNEHNIKDIDLILNDSMLKCWSSYNSIEDYLDNCEENGFGFSITKAVPNELDNERMLNYQYIQCLNLSDVDIKNLVKNDIDEVKDVLGLDYRKSILFGKGKDLNYKNVWIDAEDDLHIKALMIDPNAINDEYIKHRIKKAIQKRINLMKTGKIKVAGNYQMSIGEPVIQLESMFGLEPKGLLKSGEFFIKYWMDKGVKQVGAFRSPQSCKSNARKFNISYNEEAIKWYGHLYGLIIFNAWDTSMMAMNGQDHDGDLDFTTSNQIIINGIYELPAINCKGESADKVSNPTKEDFVNCIKKSFGNKVGSVTNYGSSCYDKISLFEESSEEYKEIDYRIQCIQFYQQECIDSAKNGKPPKPIPKYWYDFRAEELKYEIDKETGELLDTEEVYNNKILYNKVLTEKKPYFFRYIYNDVNKEYLDFKKKTDANCARRFRCKVEDLKAREHLTEEQMEFLEWYDIKNPLSINPCIVNKIAWLIEENFDTVNRVPNNSFDSSIYKDNSIEIELNSNTISCIKTICEDYRKSIQNQYSYSDFNDKTDLNKVKEDSINKLRLDIFEIIPNMMQLTNALVYLAYDKKVISQFIVWIVCGKQIIENMLNNNNRQISFPTKDIKGDLRYGGNIFKMSSKIIKMEGDKQ